MRYLTISQVAEYLSVSKPTIYMWVKKGVIPYKRITKRIIRFDKEEIDAFMKKTA